MIMSVELANALKEMADGLISTKKLCDFGIATVTDPEKPLIQLDGNQGPLPEGCVSVPDYLKTYEVQVSGEFHGEDHSGALTVDNSLKMGDKVYFVRQTGAQKYLIIGRIK